MFQLFRLPLATQKLARILRYFSFLPDDYVTTLELWEGQMVQLWDAGTGASILKRNGSRHRGSGWEDAQCVRKYHAIHPGGGYIWVLRMVSVCI
jgi:hypothetical protein